MSGAYLLTGISTVASWCPSIVPIMHTVGSYSTPSVEGGDRGIDAFGPALGGSARLPLIQRFCARMVALF
jgi:hypothetical protein